MSPDGDEALPSVQSVAKQVEDRSALSPCAKSIQRLIPQQLALIEPFNRGLSHLSNHRHSPHTIKSVLLTDVRSMED